MILLDLAETAQLPDLPGFEKAVDFLKHCPCDQPDGTVEIDGRNVCAIVQTYETRKEDSAPRFEAHRKYIDIQFLLSGCELMGWAPEHAVEITEAYNEDKDILFGTVPDSSSAFTFFRAGQAIVLFPSDAHAPGLAKGRPQKVKKVVVKIRAASK